MIDFVTGKTKWVGEKSILVMVNGVGFSIHVPNAQKIQEGADVELYTHMHWNQEKGPSLFGFQSELDKAIFLMIIECPKVGPSIALNVLSGIAPLPDEANPLNSSKDCDEPFLTDIFHKSTCSALESKP